MLSRKLIFGVAICIISIPQPIFAARDFTFESHAKSGVPSRIRTFFDCQRHSPGATGGGTAEHGTVVAKFVTQNRCGNPNEPTNEIWYTSTPGFKGVDTVTIAASGNVNVIIEVTVD